MTQRRFVALWAVAVVVLTPLAGWWGYLLGVRAKQEDLKQLNVVMERIREDRRAVERLAAACGVTP